MTDRIISTNTTTTTGPGTDEVITESAVCGQFHSTTGGIQKTTAIPILSGGISANQRSVPDR